MLGCTACEIMRNEAYFYVRRRSAPQQMGAFGQPAQQNNFGDTTWTKKKTTRF